MQLQELVKIPDIKFIYCRGGEFLAEVDEITADGVRFAIGESAVNDGSSFNEDFLYFDHCDVELSSDGKFIILDTEGEERKFQALIPLKIAA